MTVAPRILFFPDAGPAVGGGHVMRCLTLTQALTEAGAVCAFAATPAALMVLGAFAGPEVSRWPIRAAELGAAVAEAAARVRAWGAGLVVLDHYGMGLAHERVLAATGARLAVLDDLARAHDADLVIDPTLGRANADYPGRAALTGADYALVRAAFVEKAVGLSAEAREAPVRRILVSLGLTDVGGVTARVAEALAPILGERALDVVVGAEAASLPILRQMAARDPRLHVHVDVADMAALMIQADLAVGAGGSSAWERCCLGLPSVILVLAENQRLNSIALAEAGAGVTIDAAAPDFAAQLTGAVTGLIDAPARRVALARSSSALCDGRGAARVAAALMGLLAVNRRRW
jgi:UDP-2,4-diacetamido-2,4,6-trideoxy-beta-L-altropyranose hydrolase